MNTFEILVLSITCWGDCWGDDAPMSTSDQLNLSVESWRWLYVLRLLPQRLNIDNAHHMVMNVRQLAIWQIALLLAYHVKELRIFWTINLAWLSLLFGGCRVFCQRIQSTLGWLHHEKIWYFMGHIQLISLKISESKMRVRNDIGLWSSYISAA